MSIKKIVKKITKKVVRKIPKKVVTKIAKKVVKKNTKNVTMKKKTTKKTTRKKTGVKKHVRALVCAPGEHCFWTSDGKVLKDLDQLQMAFGTMGDEVFLHHVTKAKNDFADWVEYILDDIECAQALRGSKKASSSRTVIVRCLRGYNL